VPNPEEQRIRREARAALLQRTGVGAES